VSIDNGSYATSSAKVELALTWPEGATSAIVANDAAFDAAGNATSVGAGTTSLAWTLSPLAPEGRDAPVGTSGTSGTSGATRSFERTVYVQFDGSAGGPVVETASIVLDTSPPRLTSATLLEASGAKAMLLRIVASDPISGVAAVQSRPLHGSATTTTLTPPTRPGFFKLDTVVAQETSLPPAQVRVESAGGTWSPWVAVTPELSVQPRLHGGALLSAPFGTQVLLRGFDYQPLAVTRTKGKLDDENVTFSAGAYTSALATSVLSQMAKLGYNAVRVFVNVNQVGAVHGKGLNLGYLERIADFLTKANADGIRVLLCTGELPTTGGYLPTPNPLLAGTNAYYLAPGDLAAKQRYLTDLVHGLEADGAPLSDVLWELAGEQVWDNREAPLSLKRQIVQTAAGRFDMASAASRAAMETANLTHWVNVESDTLHRLLPGSLVGVGIYAPSINLKRPGWSVYPGPLFSASTHNDFVDIHVYSNLGSQLTQMESFGASSTRKALIMGEFGAARSAFSSPALGAKGEVAWEQQSCHVGGIRLSGWLLWTWNSSAQLEYWTALDGNEAIAKAMAPVTRPNPCA
jgi:hypothetical protein